MHQKSKRLNELFEDYKRRKITRDEIMQEMNMSDMSVINALSRRKIPLWDRKKRGGYNPLGKFRKLYQERKFTRREICKKFGVKFKSLSASLNHFGIELWDQERKTNGQKDYPGKYYDPKKDKSPYAKMFYEFND